MLSIFLLGSPQLVLDEQPLGALRRKNRALLYYLAAHTTPLTRDHLLNVFWAGHESPEAKALFRTVLYEIRKQVKTALTVVGDSIALGSDTWVDTHEFETLLNNPRPTAEMLTSAIALYRGDFLNDFLLQDGPEFNEWAERRRQYYRSLMVSALTTFSQHLELAGRYSKALEVVQRAATIDPLQENIQCACIRLYYLNGDRAGAVRQYDGFCKLLDQEMGIPPMPETRALYDAIISDKSPGFANLSSNTVLTQVPALTSLPISDSLNLPFAGRHHELQMLASPDLWNKVIVIEGEPGIGKTRLVQEAIAAFVNSWGQNAQDRILILQGVAHELEQGLPFQPIIDALRSLFKRAEWPLLLKSLSVAPVWMTEIARLTPELMEYFPSAPLAAPTTDESRLWEGLNQLFLDLARRSHVVLFLDDLHWADSSTVALLGYLARHTISPSFRLIATTRPVASGSTLERLLQALNYEQRVWRSSLSALALSDIQVLARQVGFQDSDLVSNWLIRHTEGNPYFLTELIRHAHNEGWLGRKPKVDITSLTASTVIPQTIQNLIESRLSGLSDNARRILELAAVLGREFPFEMIVQALPQSEGAILDALDELRTALLIKVQVDEQYTFDHSLTMEVIYQGMTDARVRSLHRRVAQTLEMMYRDSLDPAAGMIAYHFARGNVPAQATLYALKAGHYASSLAAWAEALTFYMQVLEAPIDDAQRLVVLMGVGHVYQHTGALPQSSDTLRAALALAREQRNLGSMETIYLMLSLSLIPQSRYTEAIALGEELCQSGPPELAVCGQFMWGSGLSVESAHPHEAERHLREAEKLFLEEQPGGYKSRITLALIKYQLAGVLGQQGLASQAVSLYWEVLALTREDETVLDLLRQIMLYNDVAYQLHLLGDPAAASYAEAGIQMAWEKGSLPHIPYLLSTLGEIALAKGDLEQAEHYFAEGLMQAEKIPILERIAGLKANLGLVYRQRKDPEKAKEHLLDALARAEELGGGHLAVRIRIWLASVTPSAAARTYLQEARQIAQKSGFSGLLDEIAQLELDLA